MPYQYTTWTPQFAKSNSIKPQGQPAPEIIAMAWGFVWVSPLNDNTGFYIKGIKKYGNFVLGVFTGCFSCIYTCLLNDSFDVYYENSWLCHSFKKLLLTPYDHITTSEMQRWQTPNYTCCIMQIYWGMEKILMPHKINRALAFELLCIESCVQMFCLQTFKSYFDWLEYDS